MVEWQYVWNGTGSAAFEESRKIDLEAFLNCSAHFPINLPIGVWTLNFFNPEQVAAENAEVAVLFDGKELGKVNLSGSPKAQVFGIETKQEGMHTLTLQGDHEAIRKTAGGMSLKRTA